MVPVPHLALETQLQCTFPWYIGSKGCQDTKIVVGFQVNVAKSRDSYEHGCKKG